MSMAAWHRHVAGVAFRDLYRILKTIPELEPSKPHMLESMGERWKCRRKKDATTMIPKRAVLGFLAYMRVRCPLCERNSYHPTQVSDAKYLKPALGLLSDEWRTVTCDLLAPFCRRCRKKIREDFDDTLAKHLAKKATEYRRHSKQ